MNRSILTKLGKICTVEDMQKNLNIKKATAINYIYLLRKKGLVKTIYKKNRTRIYFIKRVRKPVIGNESFYHIINKYSPMKVVYGPDYRVIGRKISVEEAIVKAIETRHPKIILASLALFNHVKNWYLVLKFAREYNVRRKIGALYELTRRFMKVRRIDKRILNALLKAKSEPKFITENFKSKDFKDIERKWDIFLPFNKVDMMEYEKWW